MAHPLEWTTEDLLLGARRKSQVSSTTKLTDDQILALANEELQTFFVPLIRNVREDYWLTESDLTLVSGQRYYRIPHRAVMNSLVDVSVVQGGKRRPLKRVNVEDSWTLTSDDQGEPRYYTVEATRVALFPLPAANQGALRLRYERRPGNLTTPHNCGHITAVNVIARTISVDIKAFAVGQKVDVTEHVSGFDTTLESGLITNVSGGSPPQTITFAVGTDLSRVAVSDFACLEGFTCVPQLPDEFHFALIYKTAETMLREIGDNAGAERIKADLMERLGEMVKSLTPRVNADPRVVFNPGSPMRIGRWF
jgi:hypothetical protein